jgi:hypothetical protein
MWQNFLIVIGAGVALFCTGLYAEDHTDSLSSERSRSEESPRAESIEASESWATDFLKDAFQIRKSRAERQAENLFKHLANSDEEEALKGIISLATSLNWDDKKAALELAKKELEKKEVRETGTRRELAERVKWALEGLLNEERGKSTLENNIKSKVKDLSEVADAEAQKFQENIDKAAEGEEAAREAILSKYTPDQLIDYLGQHKDDESGVKLAKVLGWQDKNGVTHLDVKTSTGSQSGDQTWTLGKTDEEIKKSLEAFDSHSLDLPASKANQLQNAVLNLEPSRLGERKFVQADSKDGHLSTHDPKVIRPEDNKQFCKKDDPAFVKSQETEHRPFYFFRPFPNSDQASYASKVDGSMRNFIKDMTTGKEKGIPGAYDPVPTPDELYMTIPTTDSGSQTEGMKIYAMRDLLQDNPNPQPIYEEDATKFPDQKPLRGVYQSVGVTAKDDLSNTYRIITDMNNLSFRDYRIYSLEKKVEPLGEGPKQICADISKNVSLPMLSKDGKFVAFLDLQDKMTKIYEIGEKGDQCIPRGNLGMATSKVDFGFDKENPTVVFHKFNNNDDSDGYYRVPSSNWVGNVYTYELKTGKISRLTNNTNANSIYPAFKKDGTVVYMHHPHDATTSNEGPKSKFVVVDPKRADKFYFDLLDGRKSAKPEDKARLQSLTAIGGLWAELCSPYTSEFSLESAVMAAMSIGKEECEKMIGQYWDKFKREVTDQKRFEEVFNKDNLESLTKEKVALACLKAEPGTHSVQGQGTQTGVEAPQAAGVPQKCLNCHRGIPWNDKEKLNAPGRFKYGRTYLEDIEARINLPVQNPDGSFNPDHMPRQSLLSSDDRKLLEDWIQKMRR